MASSIIHIAVANEINKKLKMNQKELFLGTIAPDISKEVGLKKEITHFLEKNTEYPNINQFLKEYKQELRDPFVMGYFIHLYTDYFWFKYFINQIESEWITDKNKKHIEIKKDELANLIYNDYTNLNIKVIDEYHLPLDLFYEEFEEPKKIIKEYPYDKLEIIIQKTGIIIENSTYNKNYLFDIKNINAFIHTSVDIIENQIEEIMKLS